LITASFRHIRGIGPMRERQLWLRGIRSWSDLPETEILAPALDEKLRRGVQQSQERLARGDFAHFAAALPVVEHWRLLPHLLEGAACLDIELGQERAGPGCSAESEVTVIGVLDKDGPQSFVKGRNLREFLERSAHWTCLITYNGLSFDVPVLKRAFPLWEPPAAHIDLCHLFRRLGEKGGLKALEPRLGFFRPPHLAKLNGTDAAWLWQAQRRGDPLALRRLVEYNLYDVFHLKPMAELGYNRLLRRSGMTAPALTVTDRGALLYDVSRAVERAVA